LITSSPAALPAGHQQPRLHVVPDYVSSAGREAVELAAMAGLDLDPWQQLVLEGALGERPDGKWSAFEVGLVVSRQNGKGSILEARELAGLFLLGERLIIHSAHQFDTSLEAFRRLLFLIEDTPDLERRVKKVSRAHGEEGIELKTGQRVRFRTRTKGGGRGFTGYCLILDEAMILPETAHGALLPTLSARPNPQVWYTGSAVDQDVHEHGLVLTRVRERGLKGTDPGLAYFEWSPDLDIDRVGDSVEDPDVWAQANPGLGIRIGHEHVALEQRSMDPKTFAVERLGVGDWPSLTTEDQDGITLAAWDRCEDPRSRVQDPISLCFDVRPNRSAAAIAVAGTSVAGGPHVEVIEHMPGTGWVVDRLTELVRDHQVACVAYDRRGPAAALAHHLEGLGVEIRPMGAGENAEACGLLFDAVEQRTLRHLGTPELRASLKGAARRPLGDAWTWSRKTSQADISPLCAVTGALWAHNTDKPPPAPTVEPWL
jgi:hypothetical protein